ncbi:hypothetical protein K3727_20890 [Rhodobacteraceae bacterium M382]|nr:hypothetical protein K3727_20890 [Rhodobacteraceae bacterium M382]
MMRRQLFPDVFPIVTNCNSFALTLALPDTCQENKGIYVLLRHAATRKTSRTKDKRSATTTAKVRIAADFKAQRCFGSRWDGRIFSIVRRIAGKPLPRIRVITVLGILLYPGLRSLSAKRQVAPPVTQ